MHKAAFLGPKGENAVEFERLLLEVLRDHVFWRRNFHPGDPRLIDERDKQSEEYTRMVAAFRDELFEILAELKRGAPLYSPRQIGHMVTDPSMPALVGYFAGMLYNQNNVVAEAAPETVRKEHAYMSALARMIGYPPMLPTHLTPEHGRLRTPFSWGHLASGGTSANLEALWVLRNVRMYPLAVRMLAEENERFAHLATWDVVDPRGRSGELADLSTFELMNLTVDETTSLHLRINRYLAEAGDEEIAAFDAAIPTVRKAGLASFLQRYNNHFSIDPCRLPVVYISTTAHYGWKKAADVVGLGVNALRAVKTDSHIRLDVDRLAEQILRRAHHGDAALAVVSICGTTEEGAVDPLHRIEELRSELQREGLTFWHHADGAFGGFLAAMLPRDEAGDALPPSASDPLVRELVDELVGEDVYRAIASLSKADSVTIDPHKLGYTPYPAGAVLFRDYHVRDAISYAAPYLATEERAGYSGFLGQWTLEGSRPGAAAVSCYLSQEALPLTPQGHGRLMKDCVAANRSIVDALRGRFDAPDAEWITFRPFADPDSIGFCFILEPQEGTHTLDELNRFTASVWKYVAVDGRDDIGQYNFLLSKTEVSVGAYRHILGNVLPRISLANVGDGDRVILLRVFVLNPFLADWNRRERPLSELFSDFLYGVAANVFSIHTLRSFRERSGGRRMQVLVVDGGAGDLAQRLTEDTTCAAYLDVIRADETAGALPAADRVLIDASTLDPAAASGAIRRAAEAFDREQVIVRGATNDVPLDGVRTLPGGTLDVPSLLLALSERSEYGHPVA